MGRKKGSTKKDPFSALPEGFREAIEGSSTDEIRKRISDIAILDCTEKALLKQDPDVEQAKAGLKDLMEPYRENFKSYKLQIEFCKRILDDKGGGAPVS